MAHLPVKRESRARLVLLLLVAVVVAAAVAAAPAAAAPAPTTMTLNAQSTSVNWGAKAILNGILQTSGAPAQPVDQQQILVQYSASSNGPWTTTLDSPITNSAAPYTSGAYTYSWTADRNLYWQMVFADTAEWIGTTSNVVYVRVKPVLGKPACPASIRAGHKFTVSGSLKPRYPVGSRNVTVKAQRYSNGKWRSYKTYTATTSNSGSFSKYSVRLSISKTGKYRFYATTANTTTLSAGKSAYSRRMQVK